MKIYASTSEYELDQFVGTDYWIKCVYIEDPDEPLYFWYRILSKDPIRNTYKVNFVADDWVWEGECHCDLKTYKSFTSKYGTNIPVDYLLQTVRVALPLEMYNTDEFFVIDDAYWR